MWFVRHAVAIVILPGTVTAFVPLWIARRNGVRFQLPAAIPDWTLLTLGLIVSLAGATLFLSTLVLFATRGRGTLAPWDPPSRLVVDGPYRFVRNPMISGVLLITAGEALVLRSPGHAAWSALVLLINAIYFPLLEEPQLERRFGHDYRRYKDNVRRFLPRLKPWIPPAT